MKVTFALLLCLPFSFAAAQSNTTLSWYKMFTGKIENDAVTLHLHKAGHRFSGYYYHDAQMQPKPFFGEDTTAKGTITLSSFGGGGNETFRFALAQNGAAGTWQKDDSAKAKPFTAMETKSPTAFTYVYTQGAASLRPKWKDAPEATYDAAAVWPTGTTATDVYLKKAISRMFSKKSTGNETIGNLLLQQKKAYLQGYMQEHKGAKDADLKEMPSVYNMALTNQANIAYQSPTLLVLAFYNYAYTGGAHGNYGTLFTTIDLKARKQLQLSDVVNEQGKKALSGLLGQAFRTAHNLKQTDSLQQAGLFENSIQPNDNFYITPAGIGFSYTPYEIGPYAMGEVHIFVLVEHLKDYLQPRLQQLAK